MKPQYEPKGLNAHIGYLTEECGEVLAAAGKTLRWGLRREMDDLDGAIRRMRAWLDGERK